MELIQLTEAELAQFDEAFLTEIQGYIKHGEDVIATNGSHFKVGTKKNEKGQYDDKSAAVFDNLDHAKAFIDGGKKGPHKTVAGYTSHPGKVQESFIDLIQSDKAAAAEVFKQMMAEKVQAALGARRIELSQSLYSRVKGE
jgi:hypothetical protein